MQRRTLLLGLLLSFFLFVHAGAAAGAPVQVTADPANQGRPDVGGSIIVWKDIRAGNWDIYSFNLLSAIEEPVETNKAYQNLPVTNGVIVVWQDNRSGGNDIYMKNLATGVTAPLVTGPGNQGLPHIDGDRVVFVDDSLGNNNISVIDINTLAVTPVTTNAARQWQPRISGSLVVWEDERNGSIDVYMRDLDGGGEVLVAGGAGDQGVADVDGDIIVWQDQNGSDYNIRMKDLGSGATSNVTADADYQGSPRISGDLVVWENYSFAEDNYDIHARDLTTGEVLVVAGGPQIQARPAVDIETVVWEEEAAGDYDVWMELIPDTTAPVVSGLTPGDGETADCTAPAITASFSDNRTGVDVYSVHLELDGNDVTAESTVTGGSISLQAPELDDGSHTISLSVADIAGNSTSVTWEFTVESPLLRLHNAISFWATYQDFVNRELSVGYELTNLSDTAWVASSEILASPATAGVIFFTPVPNWVGPVAPLETVETTVKYLVPMSVGNFRSRLYLQVEDACGTQSYLPGPPPAL